MAGDLTQDLLDTDVWTADLLAHAGIPVEEAPFVSVGGGLGSFAVVDLLRVSGVPAADIRVLTRQDDPAATFRHLAANSQLRDDTRLWSESTAEVDNAWGFPSYAIRAAFGGRSAGAFLSPLWTAATEPILTDYYAPTAGQVYRGLSREATRIGWTGMLATGQARMVRRAADGGFYTILTPPPGPAATTRVAYRSRFVHLGVGFAGIVQDPVLQRFRETHDTTAVVHAYEPHGHVYEDLVRRPGTVVVLGGGVVAGRVITRLLADRGRFGADTQIVHLQPPADNDGHGLTWRRPRLGGARAQSFLWPRAAWGGQLRSQLERTAPAERAELLRQMEGTNLLRRRGLQRELDRAAADGCYRSLVGTLKDVELDEPGLVVQVEAADGDRNVENASYVVNAVPGRSGVREDRLLADLLDHSGAVQNGRGGLDVTRGFEVEGTRSDPGRLYASGSIVFGCHYAPVDTFLGLQAAALDICDDLASAGFGRRIGSARSIVQWWRWARNKPV